jgi:hypothetical protein
MEPQDPHEVELGRAIVALLALLEREMDATAKDIRDHLARDSPLQRLRGAAAATVVDLCRELADQIRRYEHLRALVDAGEDLPEDEIPF